MKLLSTNTKLRKFAQGYLINGLALAPHNLGGWNSCGGATLGCISACVLWFAGRSVMDSVREAMLRRKEFLLQDPVGFYRQLERELHLFAKLASRLGLAPAIRLNIASDLDFAHIAREFPQITFYDYSKIRSRFCDSSWPSNYHLLYSWNETASATFARFVLDSGRNVAIVLDTTYNPQHKQFGVLPKTVVVAGNEYPTVDGDRHDLRIPRFDGRGKIVCLRLKGTLRAKQSARDRKFAVAYSDQSVHRTICRYSSVPLHLGDF